MSPPPTLFHRPSALARLGREQFDVLVVGGGITGAGVALDAASRGLRTGLVEAHDFASGTSSRSSKLVHGGLRYLRQGEYLLVRENLVERQLLLQNAPHLVRVLPFLVPVLRRWPMIDTGLAGAYGLGLWLYDLSAGLHVGRRHRRMEVTEVRAHFPTLRADRLARAYVYYDAQADDARLTLAVVRTAVLDHGAVAANYAPVTALRKDGAGRVRGAVLGDGTEVRASVVVNATGVWADQVRRLAEGDESTSIRPAKGVHLAVPRSKLPCDMAAALPVPGDRRSIFLIPWGDRVYLGTTDTDYHGPLDEPQCTPADLAYVLDAVNAHVTRPLTVDDVVGTWAGLRPLLANKYRAGATDRRCTADLSRRHRVEVGSSGLVTVTGGKLTTYRRMAADTVDRVVRLLGQGARRSPTAHLRLRGADGMALLDQPEAQARLGLERALLEHLVGRHGGEARVIAAMVEADPSLAAPLVPSLPYLRAEAVYAARYEMAQTLTDVLARRTRAILLARQASVSAAADVARLLAPELGWGPAEVRREVAAFRALVEKECRAAALPCSGSVPATRDGPPTTASLGGPDVPPQATPPPLFSSLGG